MAAAEEYKAHKELEGKLAVLTSSADSQAKRLAAANALRTLILHNPSVAVQQFVTLLQHLEPLLYDSSDAVRRQLPRLLGAVGAAQRPDLHGFCRWLVDAFQRHGGQEVAGRPGAWGLLLITLNECLQQLVLDRAVACAAPALPHALGCIRWMLDQIHEPSLLPALLPLLTTCSQPELCEVRDRTRARSHARATRSCVRDATRDKTRPRAGVTPFRWLRSARTERRGGT